jgi:nucleoside-diphosphate-sugar epimerase
MDILLTGSTGFLGNIILNKLNSYNVKTLSRSNSVYNIDLSKNIPEFFQKFDLVIHAAGKAHIIPISDIQHNDFFDINVVGTINLLKGLEKNSLPRQFVFISSVSVYGLVEGRNISEDSPLLARDPYGESKIKAEQVVKKWCDEKNVQCTILRLPLVISIDAPGNLGAMIRGIKKGYYFNIGGGTAQKSMVLASDIAKFIFNAAEIGGIYNLSDGMHPTFNELSKCISINFNKSIVLNMPIFIAKFFAKIGDKLGDTFPINSNKLSKITSTLTFDDSKARMAFGWNPTYVLSGFKLQEDAQ